MWTLLLSCCANQAGWTAIHFAAANNQKKVLEQLLLSSLRCACSGPILITMMDARHCGTLLKMVIWILLMFFLPIEPILTTEGDAFSNDIAIT